MPKISNHNLNLEFLIPALEVVDRILTILKKENESENIVDRIMLEKEDQKQFQEGIEEFNKLYVTMSKNLVDKESGNELTQNEISQFKQEIDIFKKCNKIMWKILLF